VMRISPSTDEIRRLKMASPRPPHLHRQITQQGKVVWYVRIGKVRALELGPHSARRNLTSNTRPRVLAIRARPKRTPPRAHSHG